MNGTVHAATFAADARSDRETVGSGIGAVRTPRPTSLPEEGRQVAGKRRLVPAGRSAGATGLQRRPSTGGLRNLPVPWSSFALPTGDWKVPRTRRQECLRYKSGAVSKSLALSVLISRCAGGGYTSEAVSITIPPGASPAETLPFLAGFAARFRVP